MENLTVNILGTEYRIETRKVSEDKFLKDNHFGGYCAEDEYLIVVADLTESEYFSNITDSETEVYRKKILRHELFHAFLSESGLQSSALQPECPWSKNEEMVDWFAIQSPKIFKVFQELDLI